MVKSIGSRSSKRGLKKLKVSVPVKKARAPLPKPHPANIAQNSPARQAVSDVTVQIWTVRTGNSLMLRLSINVPPAVQSVLAALMTNAAMYSQTRLAFHAGLGGKVLAGVLRHVRTTTPRMMAVQTGTAQPPLAITTNGILPSLDQTIANLAGLLVMAWQKYGQNPQPNIQYVQFDDEIIVGQPPATPANPLATSSNSPANDDEPGLISEGWVTGIIASLAMMGIQTMLNQEVNPAAEAVANALDYLKEQLGDIAQDLANSPENPNPPMGTSPTDLGTDDNPDGGTEGTQDDDNGGQEGDDDDDGGGGGPNVPGEDGTLPVIME